MVAGWMEIECRRSLVGVPGGTLSIDRKEMGPKPQTFRAGESLPEGGESGGWFGPTTPPGSSLERRRVAALRLYCIFLNYTCEMTILNVYRAILAPEPGTRVGASPPATVADGLSRQIEACLFHFSAGNGCLRCRSTCTPRSATSGGRTPSILPAAPRVAGLI